MGKRSASSTFVANLARYLPLPLSSLKVSAPVPVDIWNPKGVLLLSKNQVIESRNQLDQLSGLHPVVKEAHYFELLLGSDDPQDIITGADLDPLVGWPALHTRLTRLLRGEMSEDLPNRLAVIRAAATKMLASHRDKSLFMLMQMLYDWNQGYCASHALMATAICQLIATDAGIEAWDAESLCNAALTMNIGMSALQDRLAQQQLPPDDLQREGIASHPSVGANLLRDMAVTDPLWLQLVESHHAPGTDHEDTAGNSAAIAAQMLWMVDQLVARLSPRRTRNGLAPDKAMRDIYVAMQARDTALGNLLVRSLGIYPPGSYVRLRTGEIAVVVGSGDKAHQPQTLAVVGKDGVQFQHPIPRDTQAENCAVTESLVIASDLSIQLNPTRLFKPR